MLEAFFTRQRQRNIFVLLTAITGLIWGGTQTIIVTQSPPQASQTTSEVAATADTAATTNSRTLKPVQPIEVTPTPETSPASQAAAAVTPTTAPAISVTAGRTDRVETTDAISYVLHFNVTIPADVTSSAITTKVTTDVGCMEPATAAFSSTNQMVTCTVLKSALQTAPDQLNFKLDVLNDATSYGQLSFVVAK